MKAIIIAAGMGLRMKPFTDDTPKCMLKFNDKTLLRHQIDTLRKAGIKDIIVVKGYREEKINYKDVTYYMNNDYRNNNILHSLFCAEREMDGEFVAVYSDIIYDKDILEKLMADRRDISVAVDTDWLKCYGGRAGHPIDEAECVMFDADKKVVKIGKKLPNKDRCHGEFIGIMKCSKLGADIYRTHFNRLRKTHSGKPFHETTVFEKAYLTDMIQDLTISGIPVFCVTVEGGWREIDTVEDYEKLLAGFSLKEKGFSFYDNQD